MQNKYYTTQEVANMLGISRVAVFKQIKQGKIDARKMGRQYLIAEADLPKGLSSELSDLERKKIEDSVKKTVREYGETLRLLGQE